AESAGCGSELTMRVRGMLPVHREDIDELLDRVEDLDVRVGQECRDTLRALSLYCARGRLREIGYSFLVLEDGIDEQTRAEWGFRARNRLPQLLFHDLVRLFALTGPVVLAVDQIDTVIARCGLGGRASPPRWPVPRDRLHPAPAPLAGAAGGLRRPRCARVHPAQAAPAAGTAHPRLSGRAQPRRAASFRRRARGHAAAGPA